jgi:hypothetical protein
VAEDFSRFVFTPTSPQDAITMRGAYFVTEGAIFPGGTIQGDDSSFEPGGIGSWLCTGTHLVDATQIPDAPIWVSTTQLFLFRLRRR